MLLVLATGRLAYQRELVGTAPPFPPEIEQRIDQYLVRQAALKAGRDNPERQGADDGLNLAGALIPGRRRLEVPPA